jgi:hypothetical protein
MASLRKQYRQHRQDRKDRNDESRQLSRDVLANAQAQAANDMAHIVEPERYNLRRTET